MDKLNAPALSGTNYIEDHRLHVFIEGSLEVKLPTIWTVEKQR